MATEFKLPYTASQINEKLSKINEIDTIKTKVNDIDEIKTKVDDIDTIKTKVSDIDTLKNLVGSTPVYEQIADAFVDVYVQDEEPTGVTGDSIWVDTSADGIKDTSEKKSANVYVVDASTIDTTLIDFSQFAIGDVIVVTVS